MLNTILGFGGRIGRLKYFFLTLGVAIALILLVLGIVLILAPHNGTSQVTSHKPNSVVIITAEDRSERSIIMIISLSFVAPDIIEAAVKGALPRGIGLTRLMNLPPLWAEQRKVLGVSF